MARAATILGAFLVLFLALDAHARAHEETLELHTELHWGKVDHGWSGSRDVDEAVDALLSLSRTGRLEMRLAATDVLGEIGTERALAALSTILWENQAEVRLRAAELLSHAEAVEVLAAALPTERDPAVRRVLLRSIAERLPMETEDLPAEEAITLTETQPTE